MISSHNKKILREYLVNTKNCNCRKGEQSCPVRGESISK